MTNPKYLCMTAHAGIVLDLCLNIEDETNLKLVSLKKTSFDKNVFSHRNTNCSAPKTVTAVIKGILQLKTVHISPHKA